MEGLWGSWEGLGASREARGRGMGKKKEQSVEVPYNIDPYHAGIENRKKEKIRFPIPAWYGAAAQKLLSD